MKVESANVAALATPRERLATESMDRDRGRDQTAPASADSSAHGIQPEELLNSVKQLTENGRYNVHFEYNHDVDKLVIHLVDAESGEQIRQIPPEELLKAGKTLKQLHGNLVDKFS